MDGCSFLAECFPAEGDGRTHGKPCTQTFGWVPQDISELKELFATGMLADPWLSVDGIVL